MIFILICALAAVGVGFAFLYARNDRVKNAEVYTATIIGVERKRVKRGSMLRTAVRPSVKYNNGKRDIIAQYSDFIYETNYHYSDGDDVVIRAYPQLPKTFYFADDDDGIPTKAIAAFIIGGACFVFWIVSEIFIA